MGMEFPYKRVQRCEEWILMFLQSGWPFTGCCSSEAALDWWMASDQKYCERWACDDELLGISASSFFKAEQEISLGCAELWWCSSSSFPSRWALPSLTLNDEPRLSRARVAWKNLGPADVLQASQQCTVTFHSTKVEFMAVSFVETTSLPKQHSNQRGVWFPSMQKACKNKNMQKHARTIYNIL